MVDFNDLVSFKEDSDEFWIDAFSLNGSNSCRGSHERIDKDVFILKTHRDTYVKLIIRDVFYAEQSCSPF